MKEEKKREKERKKRKEIKKVKVRAQKNKHTVGEAQRGYSKSLLLLSVFL